MSVDLLACFSQGRVKNCDTRPTRPSVINIDKMNADYFRLLSYGFLKFEFLTKCKAVFHVLFSGAC